MKFLYKVMLFLLTVQCKQNIDNNAFVEIFGIPESIVSQATASEEASPADATPVKKPAATPAKAATTKPAKDPNKKKKKKKSGGFMDSVMGAAKGMTATQPGMMGGGMMGGGMYGQNPYGQQNICTVNQA
jgi:hypothetical protein